MLSKDFKRYPSLQVGRKHGMRREVVIDSTIRCSPTFLPRDPLILKYSFQMMIRIKYDQSSHERKNLIKSSKPEVVPDANSEHGIPPSSLQYHPPCPIDLDLTYDEPMSEEPMKPFLPTLITTSKRNAHAEWSLRNIAKERCRCTQQVERHPNIIIAVYFCFLSDWYFIVIK